MLDLTANPTPGGGKDGVQGEAGDEPLRTSMKSCGGLSLSKSYGASNWGCFDIIMEKFDFQPHPRRGKLYRRNEKIFPL